jgi:hypothetical protein
MVTIQDASAAIVLRLPDGDLLEERGLEVEAAGRIASYFGLLEIRVDAGGLELLGGAPDPAPEPVGAGEVGEPLEARVVEVTGRVVAGPTRTSGGDVDATLEDELGDHVRVMADGSTGLATTILERGAVFNVAGIVGQRASRKDQPDGYRVWIRDLDDVLAVEEPDPVDGGTDGTGNELPDISSIATALRAAKGVFTLEGVITAGGGLLDSAGRQVVMADDTGAVELFLPADHPRLASGDGVRATGAMGTAYGAPRLRVTAVARTGSGAPPAPRALTLAPGASDVWALVRLRGTLAEVHRSGNRWRAELIVGGAMVPISGLPGSAIDPKRLIEGSAGTVTGIVRRALPSSSDKRYMVVPRGPADMDLSGAQTVAGGTSLDGADTPAGRARQTASSAGPAGTSASTSSVASPGAASPVPYRDDRPIDADLADLASLVGRHVRVGGTVLDLRGDRVSIDDGTAAGWLRLSPVAATVAADLALGDVVNAVGLVVADDGLLVEVDDPGDLSRPALVAAAPLEPVAVVIASGPGPARVTGGGRPSRVSGPGPQVPGGPASAGIGSLGLLAAIGLAVRGLRRHQSRRAVEMVVRRRLAELAEDVAPGPATDPGGHARTPNGPARAGPS